MKTLIDLSQRYASAFGFAPVLQSVQAIPGGQYMPYLGAAKAYVQGNITFEDVHLKNGSTELFFGAAHLTRSGELGNVFAPPPIIGYQKAMSLIITNHDGEDIEVVERFGARAWDIRMQGLLVDMVDHQFPLASLKKLRQAVDVKDVWEVSA